MYDDEDDDEEDEIDLERDEETLRRETAESTRGKDERVFYDDLAKKEDERHSAMRRDLAKRSLALGELRQKLRHKKTEIDAIAVKISIEEDRVDFEQKKAYRNTGDAQAAIPILSKDITSDDVSSEFSVERAQAHIKQLQEEKIAEEHLLKEKLVHLHDEERVLSQLEHTIVRM